MELGKINQLKLIDVFDNEASDYTPWLSKNLSELSSVLGYNMCDVCTEVQTENFRVDIVARKENSDDVIIIENQYGKSNHDHLGKILTYVTANEAKEAIWIVEEARTEHINVVKALNESSFMNCRYWLIQANIYCIDDSLPAVVFIPIVSPCASGVRRETTETENILRDFWNMFLLETENKCFADFWGVNATLKNYICGKMVRKQVHIIVSLSKSSYSLKYIFECPSAETNETNYDNFYSHKDEIEKLFGEPLEWRRMDGYLSCMMIAKYDTGGYMTSRDDWEYLCDDIISNAMRLKQAVSKFDCLLQ